MASSDETLVLLNPIGNDADCWRFLGPTGGCPFLYPGHGSRPRKPGWTHQLMAEEVVASFPGMLNLIGVSFGGSITAHILARFPERVRSAMIICCGGLGRAGEEGDALKQSRQSQIDKGETALRGGMEAVVRETLPRWFTAPAVNANAPGVEYMRRTLLSMDPQAWNDTWLAGANSESVTPEQLSAITQPVTLVSSKHDSATGLAGTARLHQLIPHSRLEIVPGPHMLHLEEPLVMLGALNRHMAWMRNGNRVDEPIQIPSA